MELWAGRGGHDVSGHTFLLILSFLWMLEEISPLVPILFPKLAPLYPPSQRWPFDFTDARTASIASKAHLPAPKSVGYALGLVATLSLAGLWGWMLLLTQVYFHTTWEKLSGLIVGLLAWLVLPKGS